MWWKCQNVRYKSETQTFIYKAACSAWNTENIFITFDRFRSIRSDPKFEASIRSRVMIGSRLFDPIRSLLWIGLNDPIWTWDRIESDRFQSCPRFSTPRHKLVTSGSCAASERRSWPFFNRLLPGGECQRTKVRPNHMRKFNFSFSERTNQQRIFDVYDQSRPINTHRITAASNLKRKFSAQGLHG